MLRSVGNFIVNIVHATEAHFPEDEAEHVVNHAVLHVSSLRAAAELLDVSSADRSVTFSAIVLVSAMFLLSVAGGARHFDDILCYPVRLTFPSLFEQYEQNRTNFFAASGHAQLCNDQRSRREVPQFNGAVGSVEARYADQRG